MIERARARAYILTCAKIKYIIYLYDTYIGKLHKGMDIPMSFINDNFMLKTKTARKLYAAVKELPIIDYHCHLSPKMIA